MKMKGQRFWFIKRVNLELVPQLEIVWYEQIKLSSSNSLFVHVKEWKLPLLTYVYGCINRYIRTHVYCYTMVRIHDNKNRPILVFNLM
jgi:hypothetical protein